MHLPPYLTNLPACLADEALEVFCKPLLGPQLLQLMRQTLSSGSSRKFCCLAIRTLSTESRGPEERRLYWSFGTEKLAILRERCHEEKKSSS